MRCLCCACIEIDVVVFARRTNVEVDDRRDSFEYVDAAALSADGDEFERRDVVLIVVVVVVVVDALTTTTTAATATRNIVLNVHRRHE